MNVGLVCIAAEAVVATQIQKLCDEYGYSLIPVQAASHLNVWLYTRWCWMITQRVGSTERDEFCVNSLLRPWLGTVRGGHWGLI